jgi:gamma-glutamyltranspeptidase/glutathione hydrolase
MLRLRLPLALFGSGLALALAAVVPDVSAEQTPRSYAVASESGAATREAGRVLAAGGNAIDAAICAALVAGFANPSSSGLGGGGFALVWSARDHKSYIVDFRETAPQGVDLAVLDKRPVPADQRGQTVGVPGEVAGLLELSSRFGKLPWKDVATRAARLAQLGFTAEEHTTAQVNDQLSGIIAKSPTFRSVYLPSGKPLVLGQKLRASKLSQTLSRIAVAGKRAFYEGPVALDLVKAVQQAGGALSLADLANYRTVDREPLAIDWAGKRVLTMPPPSAGGLLLAETLAVFQPAELQAWSAEPAKRLHLLAEAMRGATADRARYFGDPAFVSVEVGKLLAPERMARRKALLAEDRTHTQPRFGLEDAGTHHLVTADADGNWVSLTTTVNEAFGAKIVAEQSGILLNNELLDFSTSESVAAFGMSASPNRPRPGARPVSSMTPTLVLEDGVPNAALGGSGGLTIGPNVTQVLLNRFVDSMPAVAAVTAPRFFIPPPSSGKTLIVESALGTPYAADLEARGELLLSKDWKNAVQLVVREGGVLSAAADPRKHGSALAQ